MYEFVKKTGGVAIHFHVWSMGTRNRKINPLELTGDLELEGINPSTTFAIQFLSRSGSAYPRLSLRLCAFA